MSDRPTPETDSVEFAQRGLLYSGVNISLARKFERERDEARDIVRELLGILYPLSEKLEKDCIDFYLPEGAMDTIKKYNSLFP